MSYLRINKLMPDQPSRERVTQCRVIARFTITKSADCRRYCYLGDGHRHENNRSFESAWRRDNLNQRVSVRRIHIPFRRAVAQCHLCLAERREPSDDGC